MSLTQESLDRFLDYLDPDRQRAGEKYELVRRKLISFFHGRDCWEAEDHADEAIDRIIRKLGEEGIRSLMPFVLGVARRLASEIHRRRDPAPGPSPGPTEEEARDEERRQAWLDECMELLPPEDRDLALEYYNYEKGAKVKKRKGMAQALGISVGALRVRAHRARRQLAKCMAERMKRNLDPATDMIGGPCGDGNRA